MFKYKNQRISIKLFSHLVIGLMVLCLFAMPLSPVQAVTVTAGYHVYGSGGGGSPAPTPPPPASPSPSPVISSIAVSDITVNSARITWTTDSLSTSVVNYGLTAAYDATTTVSGFVSAHNVSLSGLAATILYHFRVRSTDALGNESISTDQTFTTLAPDTIPPIISNINVGQITGTSAKISWDTNEPATGQLNYGLTSSYGLGSVTSSTLDLSKSVVVTGLTSETDYHFQITVADAADNTTVSLDQTFQTADVTPPIISNFNVSDITITGATAGWTTNELARSELSFTAIGRTHTGTLTDVVLKTDPSFSLSGLLPNAVYTLTAKSTDGSGNQQTAGPIQFQTLADTIPPANVINLALVAGDGTITLSWSNPTDVDLAGVKILRKLSGFPTNPTDGTVIFTGSASSYLDSGLANGTMYYYGVFAYDTSNNFASGAIASGAPIAPTPIVPPPETPLPGIPPPVVPPEVLVTPPIASVGATSPMVIVENTSLKPPVPRLTFNQLELILADQTLVVSPNQLNEVHSLPASSLAMIITPTSTAEFPIQSIIVSFGGNAYILQYEANGTYQGNFVLPVSPGLYQTKILAVYNDGKEELLQFNLVIDSFGSVVENSGGKTTGLANATVTLFSENNGEMVMFNAAAFNQLNPTTTSESGSYGFLVPAGTYVLRVEQNGYRTFDSGKFEINNFVVNTPVELLAFPKTALEAIPFAGKVVLEQAQKFIKNSTVQQVNNVIIPTITTIAVVNTVAATSLIGFGQYLWYLLAQPLVLLRRRKYRKWGTIYDSLKKLPVDLALVRLYQQYTIPNDPAPHWRLAGTQVTDKQGRYLFLVKPGTYKLQAVKTSFAFPTVYLAGVTEDRGFSDVYHGEEFSVAEEKVLSYSIPLDSETKAVVSRKFDWSELFKGFQNGISFGGVLLMGVAYVITPRIQSLLFLVGNLALFILFSRLARIRKTKNWGAISDAASGKPIAGAVVRLFDQQFNKLVATATTDSKGRYSFLAGGNSYYMIIDSVGHETEQTPVFDLAGTKEKIVIKDLKLKKIL